MVVENPYRVVGNRTKFLKLVFNEDNRYDFNGQQYEIVCVSHRPPGHHNVDVKFFNHECVHHYDDMKNLGHNVPIGKYFPDSTDGNPVLGDARENIRTLYLRKLT